MHQYKRICLWRQLRFFVAGMQKTSQVIILRLKVPRISNLHYPDQARWLSRRRRHDDDAHIHVALMRFFCLAWQVGVPANVLKTMADSRRRNFVEFSSFPLIAKVNRGSRYSFRACNYIAVRKADNARRLDRPFIAFMCTCSVFWLNIRRGFCRITPGEEGRYLLCSAFVNSVLSNCEIAGFRYLA